ncbi:MAG: 23S rRNA (adenine(2503)-C(2))-methyltransferase RlmN [Planctomycetes bacterium]|nr:23S rRNA (adenine(2503)-C(2))-methyltransferase RlmN [Planctomycetota bacterium]
MRALLDLSPEEFQSWLQAQGQPPLRARQVRRWLFAGRAESFEQMTDLPLALRQALAAEFQVFGTHVTRHLRSGDGTNKLLLRLKDEQLIECVLLQEDDRHTACISTQVGCGMGCVFCASGLGGLERNLTTAEILEQLLRLRNLIPLTPDPSPPRGEGSKEGGRLSHIVVMGMGEPLANLANLLAALDGATAKDGLGLGARHVTISTVGLPAKMRRLADLKKQYHLAVSLHAPNDGLRNQIVPTNDRTGIAAILDAADYFYAQTHRQVTYEYVLLRGLNDQPRHAEELARILQKRQAHINLIPFNDVEGLPYRRPEQEELSDFVARLRRRGLVVHVRKRKGADIDAACGQLRRSALVEQGATGVTQLVSLGPKLAANRRVQ